MRLVKYYHNEFKPTIANLFKPTMLAISRLGIKPNHITLTGIPLSIIMFLFLINRKLAPAIFFLVLIMIMDGLDGQLARATGQVSKLGHALDKGVDLFCIMLMLIGIAVYSPQSVVYSTSLGVVNALLFITNELKGPFFYTAARDAGFIGMQGFKILNNPMFLNFWLFVSIGIGTFLFLRKSFMLVSDLIGKK